MDRYDKKTRSGVMRRIRKTNTKLEAKMASLLNAEGLTGYTRYAKDLPGSPDFVFRAEKVAVFLDSCFWHGCPKHLRAPRSNVDYWRNKITGNKGRDTRQTRDLRERGWRVLRFWEHRIETVKGRASVFARLRSVLT